MLPLFLCMSPPVLDGNARYSCTPILSQSSVATSGSSVATAGPEGSGREMWISLELRNGN